MIIIRVRPSLLAIHALSWHVQTCISTVSNRTIDDFYGDSVTGVVPSYDPSGVWNAVVVFDDTWHDTTSLNATDPPSVTIQFTGTAIYLFGIVPNTVPFADTIVDLTFVLDGAFLGSYTHTPDTSTTILYSVLMLSSSGLSNKTHTLLAQTAALFIFDYAIYTFDDGVSENSTTISSAGITPSSTTSSASASSNQTGTKGAKSHFPVAVVVGSICGAAAGALLVFALLWCRRRRKNQSVPPVNLELLIPLAEDSAQSWTAHPFEYPTETLPETREVSPQAPPTPVDPSLPPYTPRIRKNPVENSSPLPIAVYATGSVSAYTDTGLCRMAIRKNRE
ncbi:hypothetical protein B0H11DRAFT_1914677 [Mycena galericulata]|nr:hypothetical protein B0H11DRAFT_1914677 [Mycena galericulata]